MLYQVSYLYKISYIIYWISYILYKISEIINKISILCKNRYLIYYICCQIHDMRYLIYYIRYLN